MRVPHRRGVVTPDLAQQAGVLADCQCQHDRKESCSKHVDARDLQGQELRQLGRDATAHNPRVFEGSPRPGRATCGLSPAGADNSRRNRSVQDPACVVPWPGGGMSAAHSRIPCLQGATLATRHREGAVLIPAPPDDVFQVCRRSLPLFVAHEPVVVDDGWRADVDRLGQREGPSRRSHIGLRGTVL